METNYKHDESDIINSIALDLGIQFFKKNSFCDEN